MFNRTVFNVFWNEYLAHNDWEKEVLITSFLRAGARVDVKNPVTGQTALESAVAGCNHCDEDQGITLQFLLKQTTACSLARSHIYDVLDSQLTTIWTHIDSFILIMQHGWVSKRARAYAFDWLVSYLTGSPSKDGIYLDLHDPDFNAKATRLFPQFLDRQQLRELWEKGQSGLSIKRGRAVWERSDVRRRWRTLPWWEIHARSDNVKGIEVLFDNDFGDVKLLAIGSDDNSYYEEEDDQAVRFIKANNGAQTPIMVAISAGNPDAAEALIMIESQKYTIKSETFACDHPELRYYDTCRRCDHSQRSAYEIAMLRGDVGLLELMWDYQPKGTAWEIWLEGMPRVLSYGNVMVEWIHVNLCLNTMKPLQMSGEGASLRTEAEKKLLQLHSEIIKTQGAWIDRAKSLGRQVEAPKSLPFSTNYNLAVRH
ncbi:hypothetical protein KJ359_004225 [Pestalotiopsis sp. 9143b]|nr:hypothetical protein KJ359_004225 [Pestalotiopsis sp. 9143b]